jgi:hypothetical protein
MTKSSAVFASFALVCIFVGAGCSYGSGGGALVSQPVAASPTIAPTAQVSLSDTGTTTVKVSAGNATASVTFPEVQATAATVTVLGSGSLPSNVAQLSSVVAYVSVNATLPFSLPTTPRFSFALPTPEPGATATPDVTYYVAYLAPNATSWVEPLLGPGQVTPGVEESIIFPVVATPTSIAANQNYSYALYSVPATP